MKWFKFDWFTSKEREELNTLRRLEQQRQSNLSVIAYPSAGDTTTERAERPFKSLYFSGDIITVVLRDGSLISKKGDKGVFELVRDATTEKDVLDLLSETQVAVTVSRIESPEERELVLNNLSILSANPEFEVKGKNVFLKGVNLSMPASVISTFIEICEKLDKVDIPGKEDEFKELDEQYQALKMFWIKLALNGLEQSREDLLRFVKENDIRITRNGNLVLYRRIVTVGEKGTVDRRLIEFVSQQYYKVKKNKKGPGNYWVYEIDGDYLLENYESSNFLIGNLKELYNKLPEMEANKYTSAHNKGRYTIQIGSIYKEDESKINLDNGLCAAGGLHAAAVNYDYSGFGDTPVVVLVNPSKAITVPLNDKAKLRTTEMFIACINDKPIGQHFDEDSLSAFDEEYNNLTIQELEEAIKDKSFKVASVEDKVSPITFTDLESIKNMLQSRVKKV